MRMRADDGRGLDQKRPKPISAGMSPPISFQLAFRAHTITGRGARATTLGARLLFGWENDDGEESVE